MQPETMLERILTQRGGTKQFLKPCLSATAIFLCKTDGVQVHFAVMSEELPGGNRPSPLVDLPIYPIAPPTVSPHSETPADDKATAHANSATAPDALAVAPPLPPRDVSNLPNGPRLYCVAMAFLCSVYIILITSFPMLIAWKGAWRQFRVALGIFLGEVIIALLAIWVSYHFGDGSRRRIYKAGIAVRA